MHRIELRFLGGTPAALEEDEPLPARRLRQRQYHSAIGRELPRERLRQVRRRRGDDDRMKRRRLLEAAIAIAMHEAQVGEPQGEEVAARALVQRLDALDGVDLG